MGEAILFDFPARGERSKERSKLWGSAFAYASPHQKKTMKPENLSKREHVDRAKEALRKKFFLIDTVDGLKDRLIVLYGSLFSAWRKFIDVDQNGVVARKEFSEACTNMGVQNAKVLWQKLDPHEIGQITFKDFDPETAEM